MIYKIIKETFIKFNAEIILMGLIKIEKSNKRISDAPLRVKIFVAIISCVAIGLGIYLITTNETIKSDLGVAIVLGIIALGVMTLLLYELLKGIKGSRHIVSVAVGALLIGLFGFWIGIIAALLLDYYLFYTKSVRRFFQ